MESLAPRSGVNPRSRHQRERGAMDTTRKNFIGGAWRDARSDRTDAVIDPATGEVITEVASSNEADVAAAVESAAAAFDEWAATAPGERAKALSALADRLEERADHLVAIESRNVGKPISAVPDEIGFLADNLRYFGAGAAEPHHPGARRVPRRLHVDPSARATRRRRLDRPVELPADDGGLEGRAGTGGREHRRAEAVGAHTAHRSRARGHRVRPLPAGGAQRDHR